MSSNVIDIEERMEYTVSEVICVSCYKRWIAVRPTATLLKDLECPKCGQGFVIETGQVIQNEE